MIYLDIDDFKGLNDRFGHDVGDVVLAELSDRLIAVMRSTDTLARFGGDEFVAACADLGGAEDAERIAAHMIAAVGEQWAIDGQVIPVTIRIGIAPASSHVALPAVLLRDSDAAMYRAKKRPGPARRGSSRRAERASDLGGDTGNRTPELLRANSRLNRRLVSLSPFVRQLVGLVLGWCCGRCRTFLEYGPLQPQQNETALGGLVWVKGLNRLLAGSS